MKRRTWPCSSRRWVLRAGKVVSISVISSGRLPAFDLTSRVPLVCLWNALGSRTLTDTDASRHELVLFTLFLQIGFEIGQARTYRRLKLVGSGQRVSGLEAVASDAGDSNLIRTDASMRIEAGGNGSGDSACCLGEDTFGFGQLLDRRHDLDVRNVLGPAAALANAARRIDTVRRVANRERACDRRRPLRIDVCSAGL